MNLLLLLLKFGFLKKKKTIIFTFYCNTPLFFILFWHTHVSGDDLRIGAWTTDPVPAVVSSARIRGVRSCAVWVPTAKGEPIAEDTWTETLSGIVAEAEKWDAPAKIEAYVGIGGKNGDSVLYVFILHIFFLSFFLSFFFFFSICT